MVSRGPHNPAISWTPHLKVAWGGALGAGPEIWTNSVRFVYLAPGFVVTAAEFDAMKDGVWTALKKWFQAASTGGANYSNSYIGREAHLDWLKINSVASSGLQYQGDTNIYAPESISGADLNDVPFYQTYALTFRTGIKRGRGHAGRIFPPLAQPVVTAGQCSVDAAGSMAIAGGQLLSEMQTAIRTATQVGSFSVCSPGNAAKATVPVSFIITSVEVDRTPDVQHRRTNRLTRAPGTPFAVV